MNEQLEKLIDDIMTSLDHLEEETFKNHRENYIIKKGIIEEHRDQLKRITRTLNESTSSQEMERIQLELNSIRVDVEKGCLPNHENDGQTFQELMNDLNEDKVEMELPKEIINTSHIDQALDELTLPKKQEEIVIQVPTIEEIPSLPEQVELPKINTQPVSAPQTNAPQVEEAEIANDIDLSILDSIIDANDTSSTGTDAFRI